MVVWIDLTCIFFAMTYDKRCPKLTESFLFHWSEMEFRPSIT